MPGVAVSAPTRKQDLPRNPSLSLSHHPPASREGAPPPTSCGKIGLAIFPSPRRLGERESFTHPKRAEAAAACPHSRCALKRQGGLGLKPPAGLSTHELIHATDNQRSPMLPRPAALTGVIFADLEEACDGNAVAFAVGRGQAVPVDARGSAVGIGSRGAGLSLGISSQKDVAARFPEVCPRRKAPLSARP